MTSYDLKIERRKGEGKNKNLLFEVNPVYLGSQHIFIMAKGQRTSVSNAQLKHLLKLANTFRIMAEDGKWQVEPGTYQFIKKAEEHVRLEMEKQSPQRRKTMNIQYVADEERRGIISQQNLREKEG